MVEFKCQCYVVTQEGVIFLWCSFFHFFEIYIFFFFNSNLFYLFIYYIYFWLCWVFVSVRGLPLVAASWGHSSSRCAGLFNIAASLVAEHRLRTRRLSSCGSRAQLLCGMWDLPRPGLEPVSPALAGRFSTTAPPGKPQRYRSFNQFHLGNIIWMLRRAWKIMVLLLLLTYLQQYLWKSTMQMLNIRTLSKVLQIILLQCSEWDGRRLNVLTHWITSDFHRIYWKDSPFSHCLCILLEIAFTELKHIFLQNKCVNGIYIFPYLEYVVEKPK